MKRRAFIGLLGGAAAWPLAARAQRLERAPRVGVLLAFAESDPEAQACISAFENALRVLKWNKGENIEVAYRFGAADDEPSRNLSSELVRSQPDVLVAHAASALTALRRETRSIPIVAAVVGDLVGSGYVESLARPGGNITGFTAFEFAVGGKWLQFLIEVAPSTRRVMVIQNVSPSRTSYLPSIETVARTLKAQVTMPDIRSVAEASHAIRAFATEKNGGLIVLPGAFTAAHRVAIIGAAREHGLPAVYPFRYFAADGGLIAYGSNRPDIFQRAAGYVDRILKGEKPADLPVQQPTKFELVINLKTAKALGVTIPQSVLGRADHIIE